MIRLKNTLVVAYANDISHIIGEIFVDEMTELPDKDGIDGYELVQGSIARVIHSGESYVMDSNGIWYNADGNSGNTGNAGDSENVDLSNYYTKSQTNNLMSGKVDKVSGKELSTNDFTDEYKAKIDESAPQSTTYTKSETDQLIISKVAEIVSNAPSDFDTLKEIADWIENHEDSASAMNSAISANTTAINNKVDKVNGKGLSTNDFTTAYKNKLDSLSNYDDSTIKSNISTINTSLGNKVDKVSGKGLSTYDFTKTYRDKLDGLQNYNDSQVKTDIENISSQLFGLGNRINSGDDLDSYSTPGIYYSNNASLSGTLVNTPYKTGGFRLEVSRISTSSGFLQKLYPNSKILGVFFIRWYTDNAMGEWFRYSGETVTV
ncbi:MAG: pyocin knob domain-containing protein [Ruminococcus sp.]|nr:pyocin knob domain-containing protein [Ruminococcus sp.]